jgi:hypothetical protein
MDYRIPKIPTVPATTSPFVEHVGPHITPQYAGAMTFSPTLGVYCLGQMGPPALIYWSLDLDTWVLATATFSGTDSINAMVWTGAKFVAAGGSANSNTHGYVGTSPDGKIWTKISTGMATNFRNFNGLAYGYDAALGVGTVIGVGGIYAQAGIYFARSVNDGGTWTDKTIASNPNLIVLYGVAYGNGKFVAVGGGASNSLGYIYYSTDHGVSWLNAPITGTANTLYAVTYDETNGVWIAVGANGKTYKSATGINWIEVDTPRSVPLRGVAASPGGIYAVGDAASGDGYIVLSVDGGETWVEQVNPENVTMQGAFFDQSLVLYGRNVAATGKTYILGSTYTPAVEGDYDLSQYLRLYTHQYRLSTMLQDFSYDRLKYFAEDRDALYGLDNGIYVETAVGPQLDIIGEIVGMSRTLPFEPTDGSSPLLEDEFYRQLIKAKIALNHWDGKLQSIEEAWREIFPDTYTDISATQVAINWSSWYVGAFGRTPSASELAYWTAREAAGGETVSELWVAFLAAGQINNQMYTGWYPTTLITKHTGIGIFIVDNQDMSMTISVTGELASIIQDMIENDMVIPRPQGVQIKLSWATTPRKIFAYDMVNKDYGGYGTGYWGDTE